MQEQQSACRDCEDEIIRAQVSVVKRQVYDLCNRPETRDVTRDCPLRQSYQPGLTFMVSYEHPSRTEIGDRNEITVIHPEVCRAEVIHRYDGDKFSGKTWKL